MNKRFKPVSKSSAQLTLGGAEERRGEAMLEICMYVWQGKRAISHGSLLTCNDCLASG